MCGIYGIYGGNKEVAKFVYYGLYALQHRGQEGAGIAVAQPAKKLLDYYKNIGLVTEVFTDRILNSLRGNIAIGHVRYSTSGGSRFENVQPLITSYVKGQIAIAHNGNLTNTAKLKKMLQKEGNIFHTSVDSEVILNLISSYITSSSGDDDNHLIKAITEALSKVNGAYSLLIMTTNKLIGIRDNLGIRPLCLGKLEDSYMLASESCALDLVQAQYLREVNPGEMIIISEEGIKSEKLEPLQKEFNLCGISSHRYTQCVFEYIYFSRPDSIVFGECVYKIRKKLGKVLAKKYHINADVVIPIPDSGISAAIGYAEESNLPYELGLIRNHYVGRTFIKPAQAIREIDVYIKLNPIQEVISGREVVLIDDSIVRGTTCKKIVKLVKDAGAKKVHLRISSPPIKYPCFYGIDTPTHTELIAANYSQEEIAKFLNVDTLKYLTIEDLLEVVEDGNNFCVACFNGEYPV